MRYLKQNTATVITVGPFLDATDGKTPEVALTATNEHVTFMVDNSGTPTLALDVNATASGGTTDMVHITNDDAGYYSLELTAAATNYVGGALLSINYLTDHLPVFHEFTILPANVYDSLIPGTDLLDISVVQIAGAAVSTTTAQLGVNAVSLSNNAITAASINADAITDAKVASDVTIASVTGSVGSVASGGITAASIATDAIDADALAADALTEIFTKIATTAFTEAYSAKGATVTLANFIYETLQQLQEASTGGTTTETIKKRDQTTTAFTATLNSATAPTSITRAT